MKSRTYGLFVLGLMLEVAGFLGGHAENIQIVMSIIAPQYVSAKQGLTHMEKSMSLSPDQNGFDVLSRIFLRNFADLYPEKDISQMKVVKITRSRPVISFSRLHAGEKVELLFSLSNEQEIKWELSALEALVDSLKSQRIFGLSVLIFILGAVSLIVGFVIEVGEQKKRTNDAAANKTLQ